MGPLLGNRVKQVSTTTGTGTLNLSTVSSGFQAFVAELGTGNTCFYEINDNGGNWEIGIGTVTSGSPDTLSRDAVIESTNADAKVSFAAGDKDVFLAVPAKMIPFILDSLTNRAVKFWNETINGATAGDARGADALDMQWVRDAATQVASGVSSLAAGRYNTASGIDSIALGARSSAYLRGMLARAATRFSTDGDAQVMELIVTAQTTTNTPTPLLLPGGGSLVMPNSTQWFISGFVAGHKTNGTAGVGAECKMAIRRGGTAASVTLVGSPTTPVIFRTNVGHGLTYGADTTNGGPLIRVVGGTGENINWVGRLLITQVSG